MKRRTLIKSGVVAVTGLLGIVPQRRRRAQTAKLEHESIYQQMVDDGMTDITEQLQWCLRLAASGDVGVWFPCEGKVITPEDKGVWRPRAFVKITPGEYKLSRTMVIPSNVTIYGGTPQTTLHVGGYQALDVEDGGKVYCVTTIHTPPWKYGYGDARVCSTSHPMSPGQLKEWMEPSFQETVARASAHKDWPRIKEQSC